VPSVGHLIVGLAAARLHAGDEPLRPRDAAALVALALLPDADFAARALGAAAGSPWLHRGATHSVALGLAAASAFVALGWLGEPGRRWRALLCGALAAVSHPVLDAFTWGGAGLMLWWPLDTTRHLAPFHLLEASPMGRGLLTATGGRFLAWEATLFSPLLLWALRPRRKPWPARSPLEMPVRARRPRV
jgi:inner membrane protein